MEKHSIQMIINDLRSRRDALTLAHENLKIESDNWNKCVIVTSLMTGMLNPLNYAWVGNQCGGFSAYCLVFYYCLYICFNQV